MAKARGKGGAGKPQADGRRVMVVCEGALGRKLLKKGDITDDPEYVKLIGHPRKLVEEVVEEAVEVEEVKE
jgi:hypothetical protein